MNHKQSFSMNKPLTINKSGQSLIEVVIGLTVVTILAVGLVTTSLYTQKTSRSAKNETQATKLAQQAIEQIRIFRDRRPFSELNGACRYIVTTNPDPALWTLAAPSSCPPGEVIPFDDIETGGKKMTYNRWLEIQDIDPLKRKRVIVRVRWAESTGERTITNTTILSSCVTATGC